MILLDSEILVERVKGSIVIEPFNEDQLGPNSYDVRLSDKLLIYKNYKFFALDMKQDGETIRLVIPALDMWGVVELE